MRVRTKMSWKLSHQTKQNLVEKLLWFVGWFDLIGAWTVRIPHFLPADLQNVNITLRILFRPVTTQLPRIFTSIGEDYDERVLPSITTEVLKAVVVSIIQPVTLFWY